MDLKEEVRRAIQASRNYTDEQMQTLDQYSSNVGLMESDRIPDRRQTSGGPGRGKYQYEVSNNPLGANGSGANRTAVERFKRFARLNNISLDKSLLKSLEGDVDFAGLDETVQDAIFLADIEQKPQMPLDKLVSGDLPFAEAWADSHWMGGAEGRPEKVRQFNNKINREAQSQIEDYLVGKPLTGSQSGLKSQSSKNLRSIFDTSTKSVNNNSGV